MRPAVVALLGLAAGGCHWLLPLEDPDESADAVDDTDDTDSTDDRPDAEPDAALPGATCALGPGLEALALCVPFDSVAMTANYADPTKPVTLDDVTPAIRGSHDAASFAAPASSASISASGFPYESHGFSFDLWFRVDRLPLPAEGAQYLLDTQNFGIYLDHEGVHCELRTVPNIAVLGVEPGPWTHVACVVGTIDLRLYVDGNAPPTTVPTAGALTGIADKIYVGNSISGMHRFSGELDDIRIWKVDLTAVQVAELATH